MSDFRPAPRTRTRRMDLAKGPEPKPENHITPEMKATASEFYGYNKAMNAAKSAGDKARKKLLSLMVNAVPGIRAFGLTVLNDGGEKIELIAQISAPESEGMDVRRLYEILDAGKSKENLDKFLATVTATKSAVEDIHGKAMVARIAYVKIGEENVSVKPKGK